MQKKRKEGGKVEQRRIGWLFQEFGSRALWCMAGRSYLANLVPWSYVNECAMSGSSVLRRLKTHLSISCQATLNCPNWLWVMIIRKNNETDEGCAIELIIFLGAFMVWMHVGSSFDAGSGNSPLWFEMLAKGMEAVHHNSWGGLEEVPFV